MASKSAQQEPEKAEVIEEALDTLDSTLDRVKVLYEQYFLGIQKQPPTFLHTDVERKLRDLAQLQIRNTALRYRLATIQQKFGSYNSYWRRTLRQIENGTYHRNLSKVGRRAARTGAEIPEEILAAMPKLMREQVRRDREAALALARRRDLRIPDEELLTLVPEDDDDEPGFVSEPSELRRNVLTASGNLHVLEESDAFDIEAFFAEVERQDDEPTNESSPAFRDEPAPPPAAPPRHARATPEPPAQLDVEVWDLDEEPEGRPSRPPAPRRPTGPSQRAGTPPPVAPSSRPGTPLPVAPSSRAGTPPPVAPSSRAGTPPPVAPSSRAGTPPPVAPSSRAGTAPPVVPSSRAPTQRAATPAPIAGGEPVAPSSRPATPAPIAGGASPSPADGTPTTPTVSSRPRGPMGLQPRRGSSDEAAPGQLAAQAGAAGQAGQAGQPTPPSDVRPGQPPSDVRPGQPSSDVRPGQPPSDVRPGQPSSDVRPGQPPSDVRPGQPTPLGQQAPLRAAPPVGTTRIPVPPLPRIPLAPSQLARPNPVAPGAVTSQPGVAVETMAGPFPRDTLPPPAGGPVTRKSSPVVPPATVPTQTPAGADSTHPAGGATASPTERGTEGARGGEPIRPSTVPPATRGGAGRQDSSRPGVTKSPITRPAASGFRASVRQGPPPGMTDADVNALYAKYVKAKEMVGENAGPGAYGKLLRTINDQAPKIMAQYNAKGVTFSVVVKDNQVIIRAKPKT